MKMSLLVCTLLLVAATAFADSEPIDPRVVIDTGGGTVQLLTPEFTFTLTPPFCDGGPDTGWTCVFMNATGVAWDQLHLTIHPAQAPLSCEAKAFFATCIADETGGVSILFTDGLIETCAVTSNGEDVCGQEFALIFSPEFDPNTGVDLVAHEVAGVPEPGTLALVGSGAVALRRRRRSFSR